MRAAVCLMLVLAAAWPATADDTEGEGPEPADQPKTGVFATRFTERSPHSDPDRMAKVAGWPREKMPGYNIEGHAFQLVVPDAYDDNEPSGLLVFIHPHNDVTTDKFYGKHIKDVLAKHKLIWVSFSGAGNDVMPNIRLGLALDAVHNVSKRYKVDRKRIIVSGMSGGGRMACMAGVYYPRLFPGVVPMTGSLYFRDVALPDDPELRALIRPKPGPEVKAWPRGLIEPKPSLLRRMKREQRWVLLTGEVDYNMPLMRAHFEQGFEADGFEHAHYLEVTGMGHEYPDAEWFGKALSLIDGSEKKAED